MNFFFLRCLEKSKAEKVLQEFHDGLASGNFGGDMTTHKILNARYYWPTLFRDAHSYVMKCKVFQTDACR